MAQLWFARSSSLSAILVSFLALNCSLPESSPDDSSALFGGDSALGGHSSSPSGGKGSGGAPRAGGTHAGGAAHDGGSSQAGGEAHSGGTVASGGLSDVGGSTSAGGASSSGGAVGGSVSVGGANAAGGAATGGANGSGGAHAAGGASSAGGVAATGGGPELGGAPGEAEPKITFEVASAEARTCALRTGGTVYCWGDNSHDPVRGSVSLVASRPVQVPGVLGAKRVALGQSASCVIGEDGAVSCWGYVLAPEWQRVSTPVLLEGLPPAREIAIGDHFFCAVSEQGEVYCWGRNGYGVLGDGSTADHDGPLPVAGLSGVTHVAAAARFVCAVGGDGVAYCWGDNSGGQMGRPPAGDEDRQLTPLAVSGLPVVTEVALGAKHACALSEQGDVWCWGQNESGQLGDGTTEPSSTPLLVAGISGATKIVSGLFHTCAVAGDSKLYCWGSNDWGQLNDGTRTTSLAGPIPFVERQIVSASAGRTFTCAVDEDGAVTCAGFGLYGELGDGLDLGIVPPTVVPGLTNVTSLAAGRGGASNCVIVQGGAVYCWGAGTGPELETQVRPALVPAFHGAVEVSSGSVDCARMAEGTVLCRGWADGGGLGDGSTSGVVKDAVFVSGLGDAIDIDVGSGHACAVRSNGSVVCWGRNAHGELGDGTLLDSPLPVEVLGVTGVVRVAAGIHDSCAARTDGKVICWGGDRAAPVTLGTIEGALDLKLGPQFACAKRSSGMQCWGTTRFGLTYPRLWHGFFSDGTRTDRDASFGSRFDCFLEANSVRCEGQNMQGELGMPTPSVDYQSVRLDMPGARALDSGWGHTCAITADRRVTCWGYDGDAQTGYVPPPYVEFP